MEVAWAGLEAWAAAAATPWPVCVGLVPAGTGEGAGVGLVLAGVGVGVGLPIGATDTGVVLCVVGTVLVEISVCAVSVLGETSDVAGAVEGSWVGFDACCSDAGGELTLVEAWLVEPSDCPDPGLSEACDATVS